LWSKLEADYGADRLPRALTSIRLTILEPAMRALGLSDDEAEAARSRIELAMNGPVPTATAMDFEGAAPYTATATRTSTPTITPSPTPTNTATATRRPPTRTPTRTSTRRPSRTPGPTDTPGPTNTPSGADTKDPEILGYVGLDINPVGSCEVSWDVDDLHVIDDAPSSGIEWVKFKYEVPGYLGPTYLNELTLDCGGASGGGWDACYDGTSDVIEIEDGWIGEPPSNPGPSDFEVIIYAKAHDVAGHEDVFELGRYDMPHTCDDPDS
jgi:hypothetical protein